MDSNDSFDSNNDEGKNEDSFERTDKKQNIDNKDNQLEELECKNTSPEEKKLKDQNEHIPSVNNCNTKEKEKIEKQSAITKQLTSKPTSVLIQAGQCKACSSTISMLKKEIEMLKLQMLNRDIATKKVKQELDKEKCCKEAYTAKLEEEIKQLSTQINQLLLKR